MPASRPIIYGVTFCLTLATGAIGADNVLSIVPEDSLGFAVVRRIDAVDKKVAELAKLMALPAPGVFDLAKLQLDVADGIDEMGSLAFVALPSDDAGGVPVPIAIVPTSDYQSFVKELEPEDADDAINNVQIAGKPFVVGEKGGYAVLTFAEYRSRLREVLDSSKSIAKSAEPFESFLAKSDIGIVVTTAGVKLAADKGLEGLAMMKAVIEQSSPEAQPALSGLAIYESMFAAMKESVTHIGFSIRADTNSNVFAASRVLFDSETKEVESQDAPAPPGLAGLPAGSFVFALGGVMPKDSWEGWMKYSIQMSRSFPGGENLTDEKIKELTRLSTKSMKGLRGMSMVMGVSEPGASPYSAMSALIHVDDAGTFIEDYQQLLRDMTKWGEETEIPFYQFTEPEQIKVGDTTGIKVAMDLSNFLAAAGENPEVQESMKRLFGGDAVLNFYLAAVDQRTVAFAYVSKDTLLKTIEAAKKSESTLAADPGVAKTAALLRPDSQWVVYISPPGAIEFAKNMAAMFAPDGADVKIPAFPQSPPMGISANASASKVDVELVAPAAMLRAIAGYIQAMRSAD